MPDLKLTQIRTDGGTQPRERIDADVVEDYANAVRLGIKLPPVDVFYDGTDYWLADGFHRHGAYEAAGQKMIPAAVHQGTQRDAVLFSVGANASHGLRRTNNDKRRAVMRLLNDAEWAKWSDREIARRCCVDHVTVGNYRKSLSGEVHQMERKAERNGTVYTVKTAGINESRTLRYTDHTDDKPEPDVLVADEDDFAETAEERRDRARNVISTPFGDYVKTGKKEQHVNERGSFDHTMKMLSLLEQVGGVLDELEPLKPKKTSAVEVAERARAISNRLARLISRWEKG